MKKLLSAFAILAAVCLIAGPAFASPTNIGLQITPFTVAAELIGCASSTPVSVILNSYTSLGNTTTSPPTPPYAITTGTTISLTLNNGASWNTNLPVYICDFTTATIYNLIAQNTFPNAATQDIYLVNSLSPTTAYSFQLTPCVGPGTTNAGALKNQVQLPPGSVAGNTFTLCVNSVSSPNDPNVWSCAPIVVLANQFTAFLYPDSTAIDFASNMTTFVPTVPKPPVPPYDTKDCAYAGLLITSNENLGQKVAVTYPGVTSSAAFNGYCGGKLVSSSTTEGLTITAAGNLAGLAELDYDSESTSIAPHPGTSQSLFVPGSDMKICASNAPGLTTDLAIKRLSLCDNWRDPTWPLGTEIVPGCETASVLLTGGSGSSTDMSSCYKRYIVGSAAAGVTAWCLNNNATSFYIPYLNTATGSPGVQTFCTINNFSPAAALSSTTDPNGNAAVTVDILSSEDGYNVMGIGQGVWSIPPNHTALMLFSGDTITLFGPAPTYTPVPQNMGVTLNEPIGTRYSARVNVESTVLGVDMQCVQTDPNEPSGEKRNVQVTVNPNVVHRAPASLQ